ncbi:hypothetical protein FIA58_005820 [Flavobacterium jejuense]|uniref:Riboflavin synthase subunit beta n=1 Tax=Flavobacterium jejuense TaxID=1544455 RepID=A0ABX0IN13_9FLAO|nr:hypothetical protein [Flavobacterium jejuense]NHN25192.1 hypothetical protein [Flavobacterium jejuense]
MAGEGSMMHANTSLKNNRRAKKSRLENFVNSTTNGNTAFVDPIKATPKQLADIKQKLQEENKAIQRKKIILTVSIVGSILIILAVLNQFL